MASMTEESPFLPGKTPRDRAENTTLAARAILDAEVSAREAKTAKLRMLRLKKEAAEEAARVTPEKPTRPHPRKRPKKSA
jgi:hypothetical protein